MSLTTYLQSTSYTGSVKKLMTRGLAMEFIQPWYVPLPTSPQNTGMALGGIGSTFTITPASTTPVLNMLPGIQLRGADNSDLRLSDFYFSERQESAQPRFLFHDYAKFCRFNAFYPLTDADGTPLFNTDQLSEGDCLALVHQQLMNAQLYLHNSSALSRWKVALSAPTKAKIVAQQTADHAFNRLLLLDFFNGTLVDEAVNSFSLTCDWEHPTLSAQPTYCSEQTHYRACYPVAETQYQGKQQLQISKQQYSLNLPGDEKLCALPMHFSKFIVTNPTDAAMQFTLVQSQENLCGFQAIKERAGVQDASFVLSRCAFAQHNQLQTLKLADGSTLQCVTFDARNRPAALGFDGTMAIGVKVSAGLNVSAKAQFYAHQQADVVHAALHTGRINNLFEKGIFSNCEILHGAICVSGSLEPGESREVLFSSAFDFAQIALPDLRSEKKYVHYFPETVQRSMAILCSAYQEELDFAARLLAAQPKLFDAQRIDELYVQDQRAAAQFKTMASNSLSFIAEATVWDKQDRFLVRECADYPFFNSLDVYFYGSFSLLKLLPRLDGQVMCHFADAVLAQDTKTRRHFEYVDHPYADLPQDKLQGPRALRGAVIHDLGSPFDAKPDAYDWHNVKEWKDLAPKFMLMVLRHYRLSEDKAIVDYCWPAVDAAFNYLYKMVEQGQRFPLTRGTDDTFDNLSSHGISVYCGSLWIAGLRAYAELRDILAMDSAHYRDLADSANAEFNDALWDEALGYYHFFVTPLSVHDIDDKQVASLATAIRQLNIEVQADKLAICNAINRWLNVGQLDEACLALLASNKVSSPSLTETSHKKTVRQSKKWILQQVGGAYLSDTWQAKLTLDSDAVFADQMLADVYCHLLALTPICTATQKRRALTKVYDTAYQQNSPALGAANMVQCDGQPMAWDNFQAHDVWIGVQHSIATAMVQAGMDAQAKVLIDSMYRNLYLQAKIPFAAPEGFNGTCRVTVEVLHAQGIKQAQSVINALTEAGALQADGRVDAKVSQSLDEFTQRYAEAIAIANIDAAALFTLIHGTAMKYTAGKYFRPGMIFAIL